MGARRRPSRRRVRRGRRFRTAGTTHPTGARPSAGRQGRKKKSSRHIVHASASNAYAIDAGANISTVPADITAQWRDLLARHARTTVALEEALDEFGLGVSEFEVLDRLACECGERPRMQ